MSHWIDPNVEILLDTFLDAARELKLSYAIGGALAMGAHGYRRHTSDVDAYVVYGEHGQWLRALRTRGLIVEPLFRGVQYIAQLSRQSDPAERIDVLVPAGDPEMSAIEVPDSGIIANRPAEIWPVSLLVIAKFRSDRPKDQVDVEEMFDRGLFDPSEVRTVMMHMDEPELADDFVKKFGGKR